MNLISNTQIESNLRRTASKGYISLLDREQLINLSLKYFGVYENGQLIGYQCPYSGKIITDYNDIVLEHIIPISSKGGTILFNCVPAHVSINGKNEKYTNDLFEWWYKSEECFQNLSEEEKRIEYGKRLYNLTSYIIEDYKN